jgi:hypothetical protein
MNSVDFSVHRDFRLGFESTMLQVRAEAFNALNHPQLGMPGTTLTLPTTGKISSTSAPNRILQFAMRLSF